MDIGWPFYNCMFLAGVLTVTFSSSFVVPVYNITDNW